MGDTVTLMKTFASKWKALGWKVFQAVVIACVLYLGTWLHTKGELFKKAVTDVAANTMINKAQWKVYKELRAQVKAQNKKTAEIEAQWNAIYEERYRRRDLETEVEVYKRLFTLLLDQNRIKVNAISVRKPEPLKTRRRDFEDFKKEQIRQMPNAPFTKGK